MFAFVNKCNPFHAIKQQAEVEAAEEAAAQQQGEAEAAQRQAEEEAAQQQAEAEAAQRQAHKLKYMAKLVIALVGNSANTNAEEAEAAEIKRRETTQAQQERAHAHMMLYKRCCPYVQTDEEYNNSQKN